MHWTQIPFLSQEEPLEEMVTHFSVLAWKIPRTEEPGDLQSMGPKRVGYDWATEPKYHHKNHVSSVGYILEGGFFQVPKGNWEMKMPLVSTFATMTTPTISFFFSGSQHFMLRVTAEHRVLSTFMEESLSPDRIKLTFNMLKEERSFWNFFTNFHLWNLGSKLIEKT